jgi:hypothetical protein
MQAFKTSTASLGIQLKTEKGKWSMMILIYYAKTNLPLSITLKLFQRLVTTTVWKYE